MLSGISVLRCETWSVLSSVVEVNAPVEMDSSREKDHEMPHLVTASPDIELVWEVPLREPPNIDQCSDDVDCAS